MIFTIFWLFAFSHSLKILDLTCAALQTQTSSEPGTISDCNLTNAGPDGRTGPVLDVSSGSLEVFRCVFVYFKDGVIKMSSGSSLVIDNSIFRHITGGDSVYILDSESAEFIVRDCTFTDFEAGVCKSEGASCPLQFCNNLMARGTATWGTPVIRLRWTHLGSAKM
jgi:hypothetical protein